MSIIESQISKLLSAESIKSLRKGRILDMTYIAKTIAEKVRRLDGGPTLKIRRWVRKERPNIEGYNEMVEEIKFDLEILYDSLVESLMF